MDSDNDSINSWSSSYFRFPEDDDAPPSPLLNGRSQGDNGITVSDDEEASAGPAADEPPGLLSDDEDDADADSIEQEPLTFAVARLSGSKSSKQDNEIVNISHVPDCTIATIDEAIVDAYALHPNPPVLHGIFSKKWGYPGQAKKDHLPLHTTKDLEHFKKTVASRASRKRAAKMWTLSFSTMNQMATTTALSTNKKKITTGGSSSGASGSSGGPSRSFGPGASGSGSSGGPSRSFGSGASGSGSSGGPSRAFTGGPSSNVENDDPNSEASLLEKLKQIHSHPEYPGQVVWDGGPHGPMPMTAIQAALWAKFVAQGKFQASLFNPPNTQQFQQEPPKRKRLLPNSTPVAPPQQVFNIDLGGLGPLLAGQHTPSPVGRTIQSIPPPPPARTYVSMDEFLIEVGVAENRVAQFENIRQLFRDNDITLSTIKFFSVADLTDIGVSLGYARMIKTLLG
ncbi:hypothetical protein HDU98_003916 [Podochytrium sp. JEL0797]|nr:hypothetical protein HDU98_003916 [Podochytrium sp. JEL0797]